MTVRQQWIAVGAIVAIVAGGAWAATHYLGDEFTQVTVGSAAPEFRAVTTDSAATPRTFADYRGKVTLINIWATWCGPCEQEMPMLQKIWTEFRDQGVQLVAVSVDAPGMEGVIREFKTKYGITFDVLYDADARIKLDYMTTGVPESFLVGKDGIIRYKQIGEIRAPDEQQIRALLKQLLAETVE
jgi:peroxiredoxin